MNIYIDGPAAALVDAELLPETLQQKIAGDSPVEDCRVVDAAWLRTAVFAPGDIVIAGLGANSDDRDVINNLQERCAHDDARLALCTAMPAMDEEHEVALCDPTSDDLWIRAFARDHRLRVLDLHNYAVSWFLTTPKSERGKYLDGQGRFCQAIRPEFTEYMASWLVRRYFTDEFFDTTMFGASMYPELWNRETNEHDMEAAVNDTGMNAVRIGEFFWSKLEPREGQYDMSYLDGLLDRYEDAGLDVILGIPTPTPPRWFSKAHPEALITDADGVRQTHGSRQHVCTNNPDFRRKSCELAKRIAQVAERHSNVVAIQIDNEFKCHVDLCFCESCAKLWPRWLEATYGSIRALNEAWGTAIWSERYDSFDDVPMPTRTPFAHNTGLDNAFRTFTADTLNDFASQLAQVLIVHTTIPLTHNTSTNFNLRNWTLFDQLDVVGFDTYPTSSTPWWMPMNLALWRNVLPTDDFLLLETAASHVGYTGWYPSPHERGFVPTEVFLGYAAGLKSFMFWLYRGQKFGVEQPHSAIVTAAGTPDVGYGDVLEAQRSLQRCMPFLNATHPVRSSVAMIYSDDARRAFNVENGGIYNYKQIVTDFYQALSYRGVFPELIQQNEDLSSYRCVFVPFVRYVNPALLARLKAFEESGGTVILGPLTGDRAEDMAWNTEDGNGLGALGMWMGVERVVQFLSKDPQTRATFTTQADPEEPVVGLVTMFDADRVPAGIDSSSSIGEGRVALARRGNAIYIGGLPADPVHSAFWDELVERYVRPCNNIEEWLHVANGIYVFQRVNEQEVQFYCANMTDHPLAFHTVRGGRDIDGETFGAGRHELGAWQTTLLRFNRV